MKTAVGARGYTMSVDGGGTKIVAMVVDQHYRMKGVGRGGAVTATSNDWQTIRAHMEQCLDECLKQVPDGVIEALYIAMPGPVALFVECLQQRCVVRNVHTLSEGRMALMGAIQSAEGAVAISGTGSIVFWLDDERERYAGGEGYLLGDEGSGYAIARCALRALLGDDRASGYPSELQRILQSEWGRCDADEIIRRVYHSANPRTAIAMISRYVAAAAQAGDQACIALFAAAGRRLGEQVLGLLPEDRLGHTITATVAGSVWYGHSIMYQAYLAYLTAHRTGIEVRKPRYEPVVGGILLDWISRHGRPSEAMLGVFDRRFSLFFSAMPDA